LFDFGILLEEIAFSLQMRQVAENCRQKTYLFTHFLEIAIFYYRNGFIKDNFIYLCKQNFIKAADESPWGRR